jgi:hypothetical protein
MVYYVLLTDEPMPWKIWSRELGRYKSLFLVRHRHHHQQGLLRLFLDLMRVRHRHHHHEDDVGGTVGSGVDADVVVAVVAAAVAAAVVAVVAEAGVVDKTRILFLHLLLVLQHGRRLPHDDADGDLP